MTIYGFVAEPHKGGYYLISPATIEDGVIRCHDLSGFLGSWDAKVGAMFFESIDGSCLCEQAMKLANEYASIKNKEEK